MSGDTPTDAPRVYHFEHAGDVLRVVVGEDTREISPHTHFVAVERAGGKDALGVVRWSEVDQEDMDLMGYEWTTLIVLAVEGALTTRDDGTGETP